MITLSYTLTDVFARSAFRGNPVAVFIVEKRLAQRHMAAIAQELNLSEVAFVLPVDPAAGQFRARIFTPTQELPFAGHPLLGILAAVHHHFGLTGPVTITVPRGEVAGWVERRAGDVWGGFTLPVPSPATSPLPTEEITPALGAKNVAPLELYDVGARHVLVAVESLEVLQELRPNHGALSQFPDVAFNCYAGSGTQWRNRMFSPAYGVVEDAATGSAAGPLLAHAHKYRDAPVGQPCRIEQGVELGRFAEMHAQLEPSGDSLVSTTWGQCVPVGQGTLQFPETP